MMRRGWKRLGLIHGKLSSSATAERVDGFLAEWARLGTPLPDSRIATPSVDDHLQMGYRGMKKLLLARKAPEAVFCTSDLIAYGAHRAVAESQRGVDPRIEFIGFDDSPLNEWVAPWLNAVRVPYAHYGEAIVKALEHPRAVSVLAHQLVFRTA
jgi:LacI family transcriptional regulator